MTEDVKVTEVEQAMSGMGQLYWRRWCCVNWL